MLIIPAIDLIDGKCVRLTEGDFNQKKVYDSDPVEQAQIFKSLGAKRIHLVDLDGALSGKSKNRDIIKEIKKKTGLQVETGGGIRSEEDIKDLIHSGIDYLILGTFLVEKFDKVKSLMNEYGSYLLAGIDAKDGKVMTRGWLSGDTLDAVEFGKQVFDIGFKVAIYTDISRDGKLGGPNVEATKIFSSKTGLHTIISGGISSMKDVEESATLRFFGLKGIIIGKAYYEKKISLKDVISKYDDGQF